jgi:hypothetical protein
MFGVDVSGRVYLRTPAGFSPGREPVSRYDVYSPEGVKVDSLPIEHENATGGLVLSTADGLRHNFPSAIVTSLYPPGGMMQARTDSYSITVIPLGSAHPVVINHKHDTVSVRDEERKEWEAIANEAAKAVPRPGSKRQPFEPRPVPETKPALRDLYGDHDGRIWVDVYVDAEKRADVSGSGPTKRLTWRERATFDVFARDGVFLGRLQLPQQSTLLGARGDVLWVETVGENDEPMIVSYRISGAGGVAGRSEIDRK